MTKDYRSTIFLPKTDFPMKGNLPNREPVWLEKWRAMDVYGMLREKGRSIRTNLSCMTGRPTPMAIFILVMH